MPLLSGEQHFADVLSFFVSSEICGLVIVDSNGVMVYNNSSVVRSLFCSFADQNIQHKNE